MRKIVLISLAIGALAIAFGCSSNDNKVKPDTKGPKLDGKTIQLDVNGPGQEGTIGPKKEGGTTQKDTGGTADLSHMGDQCDLSGTTDPCAAYNLECVGIQNFTMGWCTTQCDKSIALKVCPNMPLTTGANKGAAAWCALSDSTQSTYWCLFICAIGGKTFPCPQGMVCEAAPYDMGAQSQRKCVPNK